VNIKEYISSGIIESYVLGLADDAERAEFEQMCAGHPEVLAARTAFEDALEQTAKAGAVVAPQHVKDGLFNALSMQRQPALTASSQTAGSIRMSGSGTSVTTHQSEAPIKRLEPSRWIKMLAAASVLLLIASTILNFYLFRQYKDYSERYSGLLASQTELAANNRALQTSVDAYRSTIDMIRNPDMSVIKMAANNVPGNASPDPSGVATIYWNKRSAEVFLMVNQLPATSPGKQYQLWAIVDGKPVSAGVFDMESAAIVQKMTNIPVAQAFAITLEKSGGNATPQGAMYVLGTI
jgi:anti-sigma-K factor RskA